MYTNDELWNHELETMYFDELYNHELETMYFDELETMYTNDELWNHELGTEQFIIKAMIDWWTDWFAMQVIELQLVNDDFFRAHRFVCTSFAMMTMPCGSIDSSFAMQSADVTTNRKHV